MASDSCKVKGKSIAAGREPAFHPDLSPITCPLSLISRRLRRVPPAAPAFAVALLPFAVFGSFSFSCFLPGFSFSPFLGELVAEGLEFGVVGVFALEVGGEAPGRQ